MSIANWLAKENRKTCESCEWNLDPSSFGEGIHAIRREDKEVICGKCEVTISRPMSSNDIILEIYELLPPRFDSFTGLRVFSFEDVMGLFDLLGVYDDLREDIYKRILFFHTKLSDALEEKRKRKQAQQKEAEAWKKGLSRGTGKRRMIH